MSEQKLDLQIMSKRFEKLEKENWRIKLIASLILLFISVIFLMGQLTPKSRTISAESFTLVDKNGKDRMLLDISNDKPSLILLDKNSKPRLGLSLIENDSPGLSLIDKNGKVRAMMYLGDDGSPILSLGNINNVPIVKLGIRDDEPSLIMRDKDGKIRISLYVAWGGGCGGPRLYGPKWERSHANGDTFWYSTAIFLG